MGKIGNLVVVDGRCMAKTDSLLLQAIAVARENVLPFSNIIPRREGGRIIGYYVLNDSGETAIATII